MLAFIWCIIGSLVLRVVVSAVLLCPPKRGAHAHKNECSFAGDDDDGGDGGDVDDHVSTGRFPAVCHIRSLSDFLFPTYLL